MEVLKWNQEREINASDLRRVGDLSYFEGPLLVLYQHTLNNYLYFVDWVDRDEFVNRWLVYKVIPRDLLKYINSQITLSSLISNIGSNQFFAVDIKRGSLLTESNIFNISEVPKGYLPEQDVFFDREECGQYDLIKKIVLDALGNSKQENHFDPRSSEQYSNTLQTDLHFALNPLSLERFITSESTLLKHPDENSKLRKISLLKNRLTDFKVKLFNNQGFILISTINISADIEENSLTEIGRFIPKKN